MRKYPICWAISNLVFQTAVYGEDIKAIRIHGNMSRKATAKTKKQLRVKIFP